jgi:putative DNA primase/helicase
MFDEPDDDLTIAEGVETAMTARAFGCGPTWACGSAGGISSLPIIPGVARLRVCLERDENGANERAAIACAARWEVAGRKVAFRLPPPRCNDINDAIRQDRL